MSKEVTKPEVAPEATTEVAKFNHFSNVDEVMQFAVHMIGTGFLPKAYDKPEKVMSAIVQGRELGVDALTAINNIHVIQGKPTLSVHLIAALLAKNNIAWELVKDCEKVFDENEKDETGKPKLLDIVTTIRFYRKWEDRVIENDFSFTFKEAKAQDLTTKDNWKRMLKIMMRTRCLTLGARFVAPEAILGLYETGEAADFSGKTYDIDAEGNAIITS